MIFNLIDGLFLCVIVFLLLKRKVDTSNLKINKNDKYYRYRRWLTILDKNKKKNQ